MTYRIISCGWNCDPNPCINSVMSQTVDTWTHHIRMDAEYWHNYAGKGVAGGYPIGALMPKTRMGMASNLWGSITSRGFDDEDVICLLDLDDELANPEVLERLSFFYQHKGILLTYGSYVTKSGAKPYCHGPYRRNDDVRQSRIFKGTHLKTFKYRLWKHLPQNALFGGDGRWLHTCSDVAIMVPLIEMAGFDRVRHINDTMVIYNDLNPYNDHKVNAEAMGCDIGHIRRQPRFDKLWTI